MIAKVRWLMLISGSHHGGDRRGHRGHRLSRFKSDGSAGAGTDVTALLPRGARIVATAVAEDRIIVTLDVGAGSRSAPST